MASDGLHAWCKACSRIYGIKYAAENPAKIVARKAKYKAANSERISEWFRSYYRRNRERKLAQFAANRAYRRASKLPPLLKPTLTRSGFKARFRRARRRVNGGSYTKEDIADIFRMQRGRCGNPACRSRLREDCEIDHIMPISLGGNSYRRNLQLLCRSCNRQKLNKHPIEFAAEGGFLL